jgi:HSP20 family protein
MQFQQTTHINGEDTMHTFAKLLDQDWTNFGNDFARIGGELEKFLSGFETTTPANSNQHPPLNVSQNEEAVQVAVELPGVDINTVSLSVEDRVLTIAKAEADTVDPTEGNWVLRERRTGGFERKVRLPWQVENDKVTAAYKHGILTVTLPRAEQDKPRKIEISA